MTASESTTKKWTADVTLGKIQAKRLNEAIAKFNWEAKTIIEITDYGTSNVTPMFTGPVNPQAEPLMQEIHERYQGTVTAKNYMAIIADVQAAMGKLAVTRHISDRRTTPEEPAYPLERETVFKILLGEITGLAVTESNVGLPASGVSVTENEAKNGVEIRFAEKPEREVLDRLKAHGFRWGFHAKCWYAKRNQQTMDFARSLAERVSV